ncbi:hypothetical protein Aph02nite_52650 [Actinoplanes philippinensis]|uniref:Preprotein translocase subunit SecG n=2 Tax=Actinoplanes philippinensis TaxID=35752 RepID=A0A1I2INP7_9ACTN|nr:hypothetical protein Aph02nite_52650 [Actinoplanes philippinensis]SFF42131.1 hypothetical protein SAMN05421541_11093 [Actinoplanes philippinensis]
MDFVVAVNNFGDTRSGGLAGPMGLFLIVLMCVATVLLIRNMNKRIRRLPDSFPLAPEQDRVSEIARGGDTAERSATTGPSDVETGRSVTSDQVGEAEVGGVRGEPAAPAPRDGAERS